MTDTPDQIGLFAQSTSLMAAVPLISGGNLCLDIANLQRLGAPIMASGNTASLALDFAGSGPEVLPMAGVTVHYQWWHRDTLGPARTSPRVSPSPGSEGILARASDHSRSVAPVIHRGPGSSPWRSRGRARSGAPATIAHRPGHGPDPSRILLTLPSRWLRPSRWSAG